MLGLKGYETPLGAASDSAPRNSFHFTISYCKLRAYPVRKEARVMRIYFGTAREIEMGRRRSAAPLKQITDKGIDEMQRVADFLRPLELVDWEAFISLSRKIRPT